MAAPDGNIVNSDVGTLGGHGVAVALLAIFVGMGFVVAFSASDGAIFGLNSSSAPGNNAPVTESEDGGADVLSRDVF
jgi:hypothetical protein